MIQTAYLLTIITVTYSETNRYLPLFAKERMRKDREISLKKKGKTEKKDDET